MAGKSSRRWIVWSLVAAVVLPVLAAGGWVAYNVYVSHNFHTVIPGSVYRSAQPLGEDIHRWTAKYGLKSVVNLRGGESDERVQGEVAAVAELKLDYYDIHLSNTKLPSADQLRELARVLETAPRPMLIHCKAGADRTSVAAVMARMALAGDDYQTASRQRSFYYLHFDADPDHVAGCLDQYEAYCRDKGQPTGGWKEFRNWVMTQYNPPAEATSKPKTAATMKAQRRQEERQD
jgi:protein tyrosine/serine phosphatase